MSRSVWNKKFIWNNTLDNLLSNLVSKIEKTKKPWSKIAADLAVEIRILGSINCFPTGKQCRERWVNYLDPELSHIPFTDDEIKYILKRVAEFEREKKPVGWVQIAKELGKRSPGRVKNEVSKIRSQTRTNLTQKKPTKKKQGESSSDQPQYSGEKLVKTSAPIVTSNNTLQGGVKSATDSHYPELFSLEFLPSIEAHFETSSPQILSLCPGDNSFIRELGELTFADFLQQHGLFSTNEEELQKEEITHWLAKDKGFQF